MRDMVTVAEKKCGLCKDDVGDSAGKDNGLCESCFLMVTMIKDNLNIAKEIIYQIDRAVTSDMTLEDKEVVIRNMELFGGSFVKTIAFLWRIADPFNKIKIERTWSNYFEEYKKFKETQEVK